MNALETGLFNKLTADSALTTKLGGQYVYNLVAPQGQAFPFVVFSLSGGGDENLTPRRLRNMVYLVKAISDDQKEAGQIDDLLDAVLHEGTLTVSGWTNFRTQRESEIRYSEVRGDETLVYHAGAMYRIRICE